MAVTHRFFKASPAVYESLRAQIDAAWGYPEPLTETSIPPTGEQWKHADGDCMMGVRVEWLEWEPVASMIPQAIQAGLVTEISSEEYWAQRPMPPLT